MNNEERRENLNLARDKAFYWADKAEQDAPLHGIGTGYMDDLMSMATMWATVANCLKEGPDADRL